MYDTSCEWRHTDMLQKWITMEPQLLMELAFPWRKSHSTFFETSLHQQIKTNLSEEETELAMNWASVLWKPVDDFESLLCALVYCTSSSQHLFWAPLWAVPVLQSEIESTKQDQIVVGATCRWSLNFLGHKLFCGLRIIALLAPDIKDI